MSNSKTPSPAQMIDSFLRRVGVGLGLVATMYGLSALGPLLPADWATYADMARTGLSILVVVIVFPAFVRFVLARRKGLCKGADADSYMAEMFKQAAHHTFTATFITLIILEAVSKAVETELPASFFIDLTLFISLGFFAAVFYKLTGADDDIEDDWEDERQDEREDAGHE